MKIKSYTLEELGIMGLSDEQKSACANVLAIVNKANAALGDEIFSADEVKAAIKAAQSETAEQSKKEIDDLTEKIKGLAESLEKAKQMGMTPAQGGLFSAKVDEMLDSKKFQDFMNGVDKGSGQFEGFNIKDITPVNFGDYTGNINYQQQQRRVVDAEMPKRVHARQFVTAVDGDPENPSLTWQEVYDFDRNARFTSENGRLSKSAFKVKEHTSGVSRVGTYIDVSKRMLKSRVYLKSIIMNKLVQSVYNAEDTAIFFGDGAGNNLKGIANYENVKSIESIIGATVVSGEAGTVLKISSANDGKDTIVELSNAYPKILDGYSITFTGAAVNTDLNKAQKINKLNDRELLLVGCKYNGAESAEVIAAMTWKVNEAGWKSVEDPNEADALNTAAAVLSYAEYTPNLVVLNDMTVNAIACKKDTLGRSLDLVKEGANGRVQIGSLNVMKSHSIAPGKYLLGDFINGCEIVDYSNVIMEWVEDRENKLTNTATLFIFEELIFPVYMPFAFAYGDIDALVTAITKEA